jgi:hypothetical protein
VFVNVSALEVRASTPTHASVRSTMLGPVKLSTSASAMQPVLLPKSFPSIVSCFATSKVLKAVAAIQRVTGSEPAGSLSACRMRESTLNCFRASETPALVAGADKSPKAWRTWRHSFSGWLPAQKAGSCSKM